MMEAEEGIQWRPPSPRGITLAQGRSRSRLVVSRYAACWGEAVETMRQGYQATRKHRGTTVREEEEENEGDMVRTTSKAPKVVL
jgi:hypothetical protein